jgi:hypothetical protein
MLAIISSKCLSGTAAALDVRITAPVYRVARAQIWPIVVAQHPRSGARTDSELRGNFILPPAVASAPSHDLVPPSPWCAGRNVARAGGAIMQADLTFSFEPADPDMNAHVFYPHFEPAGPRPASPGGNAAPSTDGHAKSCGPCGGTRELPVEVGLRQAAPSEVLLTSSQRTLQPTLCQRSS